MNKLYNNQEEITSKILIFLKLIFPNMRKTQLNFIPSLIFGIIVSKSVVASDIANALKNEQKWAQKNSIVKRIYRFWNNNLFNGKFLLNKVIVYILKNFVSKHDKKIHLAFDHMYSHDNYIIFMISMRIGTQGIPIWFHAFEGNNNDAFKIEILKNGIKKVSDLFGVGDFELIFLADRWFASTKLLDYINYLGHTYDVRLKGNISVYQNGNKIKAKKLKHRKYHAVVHENVYITDNRYKTNIVYAKTDGTKDPWIIVTNKNLNSAVNNYSHRFGAIEFVFKNQKSNGFNLEKISNMNIKAFNNMYSILCICVILMVIIGADYSKNTNCYKNLNIETHKTYINDDGKSIKVRVMSLFKCGLNLFHIAFNSPNYIRLPLTFKLYDI